MTSYGHWEKMLKPRRIRAYFEVAAAPTDVLAPVGANSSSGTEMPQIESRIYTGPALEGMLMESGLSLSVTRTYRKTSNISRTLVGNKIADHSDVVGASPVGAAPTTSSFST